MPRGRGVRFLHERLFAWMARNAMRASDYFRIPPNRVVELGSVAQIQSRTAGFGSRPVG